MSTSTSRPRSATDRLAADTRWLLRFVYTHNPFYVISAWFVFTGLRVSFDPQGKLFDTTALMVSLACYTLLLAGTAWLLIRLGQVWEDVRSLLILVVLMFMALSVATDDMLANSMTSGFFAGAAGLLFAVAVSEGLLRGMKIALPAGYRLPYYLILALFFLYPVALGLVMAAPHSPLLQWGLFAFSPLAGLLFLTLLSAIRRGPGYVAANGTPWQWPWFPWVLFGTLGLGACLRASYLCISLHQVGGTGTIFGAYFLVPLLICGCILLLEIGIVSRHLRVQQWALALPLGILALIALTGKQGIVYERFETMFTSMLGGTPLFVTLLMITGYYALAVARKVRLATEALTASLALMVLIGPATRDMSAPAQPWGAPLLLAALLQLAFGIWKWDARRCLAGAAIAIAALVVNPPGDWFMAYRGALPLHLFLLSVLALGLVFRDRHGRLLQQAGGALLLLYCLTAVAGGILTSELPPSLPYVYPLFSIGLAITFGYPLRSRLYMGIAAACAAIWLAVGMGRAYEYVRTVLYGFDQIAWGLAFFLCAAVISLFKAGYFRRRHIHRPSENYRQPGKLKGS